LRNRHLHAHESAAMGGVPPQDSTLSGPIESSLDLLPINGVAVSQYDQGEFAQRCDLERALRISTVMQLIVGDIMNELTRGRRNKNPLAVPVDADCSRNNGVSVEDRVEFRAKQRPVDFHADAAFRMRHQWQLM
jgi:hypothetical protein